MNLEILRIGTGIFILLLASYFDIFNNKIIPDWIYRSGIMMGVIFLALDNPWNWVSVITSISLTFVLSTLLYLFGIWGGADAKIMWAIAFLHPIWSSPFPFEKIIIYSYTPIIMLSNSFVLCTLGMLPLVVWRRTTKMKLTYLPWLTLGYMFVILKGDALVWIRNYTFMHF